MDEAKLTVLKQQVEDLEAQVKKLWQELTGLRDTLEAISTR